MSAALDAIVAGWAAWMMPISVHALLVVLLVLVLDRSLSRVSWPALRVALWMLVILRFVLPPSVTSPIAVAAGFDGVGSAPAVSGLDGRAGVVSALERGLFTVWLAGALAAASVEIVRRRRFRTELEHEGTLAVPDAIERALVEAARAVGLRRPPALRITELVGGPATFGMVRPVVLLPVECVSTLGPIEIGHVLLHECAHVRRKDLVSDALLRALQIVYWFHPGAWLVRTRLAGLREIACDATVAGILRERADEYRLTLLAAARRRLALRPSAEAGGLAFLHEPANVIVRLRALERSRGRYPRLRRAVASAVFVLLATTLVPSSRATAAPDVASRSSDSPADAGARTPIGALTALAPDERARDILVQTARGEARPGCLRLHLAAQQLASTAVRSPAR